MAIKICPNGHRYNTDMNSSCPICEREKSNNDFGWSEIELSGIAGAGSGNSGGWSPVSVTEPAGGNYGRVRGGAANSEATQILDGNNNYWNDDPGKTDSIDNSRGLQATERVEYQKQPVVGWLVCIEGPDKGKDFPLHGAKSTIGRRKDSSVQLSDQKISRDGFPALVVYDDKKTHKFYLASGDAASQNNVELGGNLLLGQSVINPYDEISIEDTLLVFVPFCGNDFYWKE